MAALYGLYAYGLTSAPARQLAMPGIDQRHIVFPVEEVGLCVMVSAIDVDDFQSQAQRAFAALAADTASDDAGALLQAHEDVVAALMKETTIVPFTFGTILKDEQAAVKMLRDDEKRFKSLLATFAEKEEWGVKVYADQPQFTRHIAQSAPAIRVQGEEREKLSRGAAYLLGRKQEEDLKDTAAAQLAGISTTIFRTLEEVAYEAKLNKTLPQKLTGKKTEMVLNAAYLVERKMTVRFGRQAQKLRAQYESLGLDLEITGPWPPYNFI